MRFYIPNVRHKPKGVTINCSHKHFLAVLILLFASSPSFGYDDNQWDCKLANDGKTWDCSTSESSAPVVATTKQEEPNSEPNEVTQTASLPDTAPEKSSVPRVKLTQQSTSTLQSSNTSVPRVKLTQQSIRKLQTSNTPANLSRIKKLNSWDCKAGLNGKWDCSQDRVSTVIARSQTKNAPANLSSVKYSNLWDCKTGLNGKWDCIQTRVSSTSHIANTAQESTTNHYSADRTRSAALFNQMVDQLAINPWDTCEVTTNEAQENQNLVQQNRLNASVSVQSDYAEVINENDARFSGDVLVRRADQSITADQVTYNNIDETASASGDVFYQENGFALHSQQAQLQLNKNKGRFQNNLFIMEANHARGTTQETSMVNRNITRSKNITYTTCAPGVNDWELQARTLELNKDTGRGTGRDVWVEVFDLPLLYTPYISFPIDDRRQSGILAPTFGSSDTTGTDLSIPYYWNIAPNYDATITPRIMSTRGLMLGGEFRYLSNESEGQISAEILSDTEASDLRGQLSFQDKTRITSRLHSDIDLNYVSDEDYFEDFGNSLSIASNRYLKSQASLNYRADNWTLLTKVDNYDSIDNAISSVDKPHRRLPQVLFNLRETEFGITNINMRNEFVYFDHSADTKGTRIDLHPSISLPLRTPASFITPKLGLRHTQYRLSNQTAGENSQLSRTLPILSVDSGLFFERDLDFAGGLIQTLEPRAYYLYVPHTNQDDIPLFDTSEYDFSFNQLFRENRFSGADRMADANQLTLAVSSRFIEADTGRERLRASVGSIIYFDDLNVGLTSTSPLISKKTSDVVTEVSAKITDHWSARSALQYDPHAGRTEKATLGFHYRDGANRLFNATYRSRYAGTFSLDSQGEQISNDIEQTDLSFKWPINKQWSTVGRWNYSQEHDLSLDTFIGLEKDTCCWRLRVIARRYVNDAFNEEPKLGIFFQFELKGLTSFGEKLDSFLEEGILGYQIPEQ